MCCGLQAVVDDAAAAEKPYRQDRRWQAVLSAATWPEVLRRYVLTRLHAHDAALSTDEQARAAEALATSDFTSLDPADKLCLLALACDEALDTSLLRTEIDTRLDAYEQARLPSRPRLACTAVTHACRLNLYGAVRSVHSRTSSTWVLHLTSDPYERQGPVQAARGAREEAAEQRRQLREVQEAAHAAQKRKRGDELAQLGAAVALENRQRAADADDAKYALIWPHQAYDGCCKVLIGHCPDPGGCTNGKLTCCSDWTRC
jgi:WSTF, HB1, Itc1p, MBD9 motif 1